MTGAGEGCSSSTGTATCSGDASGSVALVEGAEIASVGAGLFGAGVATFTSLVFCEGTGVFTGDAAGGEGSFASIRTARSSTEVSGRLVTIDGIDIVDVDACVSPTGVATADVCGTSGEGRIVRGVSELGFRMDVYDFIKVPAEERDS
jgi:hypothetical protein